MNGTAGRHCFDPLYAKSSHYFGRPGVYAYSIFVIELFIILVTVISACSPSPGGDYFPVSRNARWEYSAKLVFTNGKAYEGSVTNTFDGEIVIRGERYFKFTSAAEFATGAVPVKNSEIIYYRKTSDGIYRIDDKRIEEPEYLEMPVPIPLGATWVSRPPGGMATEARAQYAGTVEVNGQQYKDCLKVTYTLGDRKGVIDYYLARDIGIVKGTVVRYGTVNSTTEILLRSYRKE